MLRPQTGWPLVLPAVSDGPARCTLEVPHADATIVLKAAESTRSPDFGGYTGLCVAFAVRRLVLGLILLDGQQFWRSPPNRKTQSNR
jgi:hypothetical protein